MEDGSIEEVTGRLKLWCVQQGGGLARVEWDSAYARQDVVDRLKESLAELGIPLEEISLPPGQASNETVVRLIEKLRARAGSVVSITDIEWAFPEGGSRLDTLMALSFKREILAALPVRQIWWIPSHMTGQLILGVPDLDSWFQLRLHLTEVTAAPAPIERMDGKTVSLLDARALASRFWGRLEAARAQKFPEERIWTELAQPAVAALRSAGLEAEANAILGGVPDARRSLERDIEDLRAVRGAEDPAVLSLMERLSYLLRNQGDFAASRQLQEQRLEVSTRLLGEEDAGTLASMNNLGSTLRAQGDLAGARQLQEKVVAALARVLGEEHRHTLAAMNNLAATLGAQREFAGARWLQEWVLEVTTRVLGKEHPDTLTAMDNFAITLAEQGDLVGARRLQERARQMSAQVLGDEHPHTLTSMNNLALTLKALGDLVNARLLEDRVMEVRTRVLGDEHPLTLQSMANLAEIFEAQGDHDGALRLLCKSLAGFRKVVGENHPDTIAAAQSVKRLEGRRVTSDSR
jgi:Tetratricopeptide repeat